MQFRINSFLVALAAMALLVGTANVTQADLIAHWAFDEGAGVSTAVDTSGSAVQHNGAIDTTVYPVVTGQSGKIGNSYLFSGVQKAQAHWGDETGGVAVAAGSGSELETFTNVTLCGWFNTDNSSQHLPIISKDQQGTQPDWAGRSYNLWLHNGIRLRGRFGGPTSGDSLYAEEYVGSDVADSNWHQVVVTYVGPTYEAGNDRAASIKLYLDGDEVATKDGNFEGIYPNGEPLLLGAYRHFTGNAYAFDGLLDDLGIWDETLTAGKANSIYNVVENLGLAYDLSDMNKLFKVFDDNTPDTIGGLAWERDNDLPDPTAVDPEAELGFAWSAGGYYYVWLDEGSYQGVKGVVPEPSTLLLLASGLVGLLAYAWRKRK